MWQPTLSDHTFSKLLLVFYELKDSSLSWMCLLNLLDNSCIFKLAVITVSESAKVWMCSQTKPSTLACIDFDSLTRTWTCLSAVLQDHPVITPWTQRKKWTQINASSSTHTASYQLKSSSTLVLLEGNPSCLQVPTPHPTSGPLTRLIRRLDSQPWKRQEGNKAGHWDNNPALL